MIKKDEVRISIRRSNRTDLIVICKKCITQLMVEQEPVLVGEIVNLLADRSSKGGGCTHTLVEAGYMTAQFGVGTRFEPAHVVCETEAEGESMASGIRLSRIEPHGCGALSAKRLAAWRLSSRNGGSCQPAAKL
jgi:hypothetical protein